GGGGGGGAKGWKKRNAGCSATTSDKLDLAGLLNVLDGVVDCPGRMVVMTTNHPEKLDAALIRPGRVDKRIFLGHMKYPAALEMTEHYFKGAVTEEHKKLLKGVVGEGMSRFTPAMVEQVASEHESVDDFIHALQVFGNQ
ncbi:unnamed protein product, partial [Discosporangium mesarthrocarpum]